MENKNGDNSQETMSPPKTDGVGSFTLGVIGLIAGQIVYYPLIEPFMRLSWFISDLLPFYQNTNSDDFLLALHPICVVPTVVLNIGLGIFLGKKRLLGNEFVGSVLGGILGSFTILSLLTALFIWNWSRY